MSITRAPRPESGWYALDKRISEDARLSWAARGMLVFLLGKPDNWTISIAHLMTQTADARIRTGRDGVYALLRELEDAGYMQRRQQQVAGRFGEIDYTVSEAPIMAAPKHQLGLPLPPDVGTASPQTAQPDTALPDTAAPYPADPTLTKTDTSTKTEAEQCATRKRARSNAADVALLDELLPDWVPRDLWDSWWFDTRRKIRAENTRDSLTLNIRSLARLRAEGHDPRAVIESSIANSYRGLFEPKIPHGKTYTRGRRESDAERAERLADAASGRR